MSTIPYATPQTVQSLSWSLCLDVSAGGVAGAGIGKIVQGTDDIHQCLLTLFATVPGEDPFRPTFGVDLTQFLDKPIAVATPAIVATISQAIAQWEPRIKVDSISAAYSPIQPSQLVISVTWEPALPLGQATAFSIGTQVTTWATGRN